MCAVQVLEGLGLTQDQFIDLCILCGSDYCGTIKGAGKPVLRSPCMPVDCWSRSKCTWRAFAAGKGWHLLYAHLRLAQQCPAEQPGPSSIASSALCIHTSWLPAGIGGKRAIALLKQHNNLEGVLESLDPSKYDIPDPYPYQEARRLFKGQQGGHECPPACRDTPIVSSACT